MVQDLTNSTQIYISGTADSEPKFSHNFGSRTFNVFYMNIPRLSKICDRLPVIVSERTVLKTLCELTTKLP